MTYNKINDNEIIYMIRENRDDDSNYCMLKKYKPIVLSLANHYYKFIDNSIIDYDDLVQVGYISLKNAINNFNENRNVTFYTFAVYCITNEIRKYVNTNNNKYSCSSAYYFSLDNNNFNLEYQNQKNVDNINNISFHDFCLNLDFEEANVFILRINGFSYKEISKLLEIKYKKVDYIIQKCKNKLKKIL